MKINPKIKSMMFTTPVTVFSVGRKDSAGDRLEQESFTTYGYIYDEMKMVTNQLGEQELSTRQIYLPEDSIVRIEGTSLITCLDSEKARIIQREEYRGRDSQTLIGVIYLP